MKCPKPIAVLGQDLPVPCGQCIACRVNRQRMWVGKLLMESWTTKASFCTLTYDEQELPKCWSEDGSVAYGDLSKKHVGDFLHRYRKLWGSYRFFLVGEYGTRSERPHYHMIMYYQHPLELQARLEKAWPHGFVTVSEANDKRMRYIARYTLKKMTKLEDHRLDGRTPEFTRMSRRPPLGAWGMKAIAGQLVSRRGSAWLAANGDVPYDYRIGSDRYPISRYWREYLRSEIGYEKPKAVPKTDEERVAEREAFCVDLEAARLAAQKLERTFARWDAEAPKGTRL